MLLGIAKKLLNSISNQDKIQLFYINAHFLLNNKLLFKMIKLMSNNRKYLDLKNNMLIKTI